jgi:glycosyltransferase involved in cell wall biosynthesis
MISLVTVNRNRLRNLADVVSNWLKFEIITEIVIVDFGSEERITRASIPFDSKIRIVTVVKPDAWRIGLGINLGVDLCKNDFVLKLDSDIEIIDDTFLKIAMPLKDCFFRGDFSKGVSNGQAFFRKRDWLKIGGYNEWLSGYGFDDADFYIRMKKNGSREQMIPLGSIREIPHDPDPRGQSDIVTQSEWLASDQNQKISGNNRNSFIAYLMTWRRELRIPYKIFKNSQGIEIILDKFPNTYLRVELFASFLAQISIYGNEEQRAELGRLMSKFIVEEDGGLLINNDWVPSFSQ